MDLLPSQSERIAHRRRARLLTALFILLVWAVVARIAWGFQDEPVVKSAVNALPNAASALAKPNDTGTATTSATASPAAAPATAAARP